MEKAVSKLMELGLSQYESKAYVALLREYPARPYQISKSAGIPTAKIYEVVNRLEDRGLVTRIHGPDKGYVPKDPETAFEEWHSRYLQVLRETAEELKSVLPGRPPHIVWNIDGEDEVIRQGRRLLTDAEHSVALAGTYRLIRTWSSDLKGARERGVLLSLISHGRPEDEVLDLPVQILDRLNGIQSTQRGTVMAVDGRVALFVAPDPMSGTVQGAWTENPAIVRIATEYIKDKGFLEQAIAKHLISWAD